ncbi:hypothetical protein ES704_02778 [subsurface metagenome]|jgi:hypothetical protein
MTIDEAIKIRENQVYLDPKFCSPKVISAFKLGTEALKRIKSHRQHTIQVDFRPLPGETKD